MSVPGPLSPPGSAARPPEPTRSGAKPTPPGIEPTRSAMDPVLVELVPTTPEAPTPEAATPQEPAHEVPGHNAGTHNPGTQDSGTQDSAQDSAQKPRETGRVTDGDADATLDAQAAPLPVGDARTHPWRLLRGISVHTAGRVTAWLRTVPMRTRLVAIIAVLLAVGLGATGAITQAVVSHYLVQQVDDQLQRAASSRQLTSVLDGGSGPSDFYILLRAESGETAATAWTPSVDEHGTPDLPNLTVADAAALERAPFTVGSTGGTDPAQWRVVAVAGQWPGLDRTMQQGVIFIARPLSEVHEASRILASTLLAAGFGIIALGAVAAWLLVHRSLRPLQEIETTAAAIAAGDYTRRIPSAPERTEVGSLGASLNAMLAQIEQAFAGRDASERRMRRFVSDASHELRTPLATIRGYGELYRLGALDTREKVDDTMGRVEDAARRMGVLVNDLLVLARLDEGRPLRADSVELTSIAHDAAQDLVALDPSRVVRVVGLDGDAPPDSLTVTGDADRLRQVLTNLVGNVARHTPAGSAAELALGTTLDASDATRGSAVVEVRDHGPGVPPELAGRMFERFFRADSSRTRESGGSGLGLAIVAAIVGAHGGHVTTRSPADGGLVVRVEVPLRLLERSDADPR